MGFWGFKPFQNDYSLDEYSGYTKTKILISKFWQGIKRGASESVDVNEICGAILRSLHVYDGIMADDTEIKLISAIANKRFNAEVKDAMHESSIMMLCVATIDLEERKKMLIHATNKFKDIIKKNTYRACFDGHELWVDNNLGEEDTAYKEIYNLSRNTVNCNFTNIQNPMVLTDENVKWLINESDRYSINIGMQNCKIEYPDGALLVMPVSTSYNLLFNIRTKAVKKIYGDNIGWGLTVDKMGYSRVTVANWLKTYFSNGFYLDRSNSINSLYSIDYKSNLQDCDTSRHIDFDASTSFIKEVARYVPVYKNKAQYEQHKREANAVLKVKCTNKFYSNNKIVSYEVTDIHGGKMIVTPEQLKEAIRTNKVNCINLTLTSNNRLVSSTKN